VPTSLLSSVPSRIDLYAILKTTEKLERAYVRDFVGAAEYAAACERLIGQFRALWATVSAVPGAAPSVDAFIEAYNMSCPMAARRLRVGMVATMEHPGGGGGGKDTGGGGAGGGAREVAQAVAEFITAMDALRIQQTAVDELYPSLKSLLDALTRVRRLPPDAARRAALRAWVSRLHALPAAHRLGDNEVRQLQFDPEAGYAEFMAHID
jgi:ESCRT-I complex subunit VPS28